MYRVEIDNAGDYRFNVKSKDYEFVIDAKGKGITPPDTLLASLASCIGVYIRKYAEGAKLAISRFKITAEAELTKEKPVRFSQINVSIYLGGTALDERRKKVLSDFINNCPIHNTLETKPNISVNIS